MLILYYFIGNLTVKYLVCNIEEKKRIYYISLYMNLFIYYFVNKINYDFDYLVSSEDNNSSSLRICLLLYLYEDLLFYKENDKYMIFHHIESILGILMSLNGGNCVGYVNNCLSNEISTISLNIFQIFRKEENRYLNLLSNISFIIFYIHFIQYRLVLLTYQNYIIYYKNIELLNVNYIFLFLNSFSHLCLQYYWFIQINKSFYNKFFCKKRIKNI